MIQTLLIFLLSVVLALTILYILGIVWFEDKRNQMVRSFFIMGIIAAFWIIFNGVLVVAGEISFPAMLSIGMIFVCCLPFALLWFLLHYTKSPLARSEPVLAVIITIPLLDIFLMLMTPLHKLYFTNYDFPVPGKGIIFWIHVTLGISAILLSTAIVIKHSLKTRKYRGFAFGAGAGILISAGIHILFALNPIMRYDLSSIGFFLTFLLLAFSSHKSRIFRMRHFTVDRIFSSLDDMFFIFDEARVLIESNTAARLAFPQLSAIEGGAHISDLIDILRADMRSCKPERIFDDIVKNGNDCEGEVYLGTIAGHVKIYALNWRAVAHNRLQRGYMLSLSDISSCRRMIAEISEKNRNLVELNDRAMAASKAKSTFLANMSHEIRTPLNAILGMSHIAGKSLDNREKTAASINQITRASNHLLELLNNILDMSKIESGKFFISSEPFHPAAALNEVVDIFIQRCNDSKLTLITDIGALPPMVLGDSLRLKQVIINLLGNAVKFTDSGGQVNLTVSTRESGDLLTLTVCVSDTGIGMTADQLSRLFTVFEQADSTIAARYGGTGLGLALSQHLVGLMGGEISVSSQLGGGSAFSFTIELPIQTPQNTGRDEERTPDIPDLSGKTILIVDDIEINRIILYELLSATNATIDGAEHGAQAVGMVDNTPENHYDLILMDVQMPVMDGYAATQQIRALPRSDAATLPIVAMTANAYHEDVERALASGMTAHMAKPVDIYKFYNLINDLM